MQKLINKTFCTVPENAFTEISPFGKYLQYILSKGRLKKLRKLIRFGGCSLASVVSFHQINAIEAQRILLFCFPVVQMPR